MITVHVTRDGKTVARLRVEGQHLDVWAAGSAPFSLPLAVDPGAGPLDIVRAALDRLNERQDA